MTPAEVAAAPWWRWCEGLRTLCGNRVHSVEGGVWALQKQRGANVWTEVRLRDPKPDLSDLFLPGRLRDLLRERTGPMTHVHPNFSGEWVVWAGKGMAWSRLASGSTEIDALIAALQEVTR